MNKAVLACLPLALAAAMTTAVCAQSQAVAPSAGQAPQATAGAADAVDAQIAAFADAPLKTTDPRADDEDAAPAVRPGIHGQAGVAVGSNGYRSGFVTATMPLGDVGALGIGVSDTQIDPKHYGKFEQKSLAVSLALGDAAGPRPRGCGGDLRVNGSYVSPLWVQRMRGGPGLSDPALGEGISPDPACNLPPEASR